ncbi:MAG: hypothetical protein E6J72_17380 [Deltaproteobacteria bacterium]|nr:MAG: hypothetical protein E6J72_17380 [Deltaproteobacteria bacterium]
MAAFGIGDGCGETAPAAPALAVAELDGVGVAVGEPVGEALAVGDGFAVGDAVVFTARTTVRACGRAVLATAIVGAPTATPTTTTVHRQPRRRDCRDMTNITSAFRPFVHFRMCAAARRADGTPAGTPLA